ncbi:hypothetical protein AVEN_239945-1 [Araneus ventricosus]|uniref:Uncharacterized protein n=1 Tax=Araneus ventricosus TaxID=182803 RepID=A0A4Y2VSF4_ARAVE|nr:hypothetical protein AVEN_7740-1 [Araneus ventricosus]GBO27622.1 hypothetical protein AVEN_239945-1 [Araneus ventricosus]
MDRWICCSRVGSDVKGEGLSIELRKFWWWLVAVLKLVCSVAQPGIHRISGSGRHIYKPYPDRTEAGNQSISLATRSNDVVFSSRTYGNHNKTRVVLLFSSVFPQLSTENILPNEINYKNRIDMDLVLASKGGMGPELAYKTLESQFHVSLLTANDAFFIIEDLWVRVVISVNQHGGYYGTDLVILNYGQMTRTTPELALPLQISAPHQRERVWPLRAIWGATGPIHGGSSESGFEPGTLRPESRDLITRPPRPCLQTQNIRSRCVT